MAHRYITYLFCLLFIVEIRMSGMVVNAAYYIHMKLWRALLKTVIRDLGFVGGINVHFS